MSDSFEDRLRTAARSAPTPPPPADLIGRVLAERAAGERIILPTEEPRQRMIGQRFIFGLLVVAAAVVIALIAPPKPEQRGDSTVFVLAGADDGLFVSTAHADQPPAAPQAPPLRGIDGSKIVARSYAYRLQYVDTGGRVTPDGGG